MGQADRSRFWDTFAEDWRVDPPQAPDVTDQAWFLEEARRAPRQEGPLLVLGATPQFAGLAWPPGAWTLAIDISGGMLRRVWSPAAAGRRSGALRGDWLALPLRPGTASLAVGDGCFGVLRGPEEAAAMAREVRRVLHPQGRLLLRCFVRVPGGPTVDELFASLERGEVDRIGWFRWRVAMALQAAGETQVDRHRVWEVWRARVPDLEALAARTGLPADHVRRVQRWEGERTPLHFPTLEEVRAILLPAFRSLREASAGGAWGAHVQRLVLEPAP